MSTTSPIKYRPGRLLHSMVCWDSTLVSTPPSVTSAFCSLRYPWGDFPARQLFRQSGQGLVAGLVDGALQLGHAADPGIGQTRGQVGGQLVGYQLARVKLGLGKHLGQIHARKQIDLQRGAGLPVAGDLQHRRTGEAAMGEQQILVEAHALLCCRC